jgi:hypothetical protein
MSEFIKVRVCANQAHNSRLESAKFCGKIVKIAKSSLRENSKELNEVK